MLTNNPNTQYENSEAKESNPILTEDDLDSINKEIESIEKKIDGATDSLITEIDDIQKLIKKIDNSVIPNRLSTLANALSKELNDLKEDGKVDNQSYDELKQVLERFNNGDFTYDNIFGDMYDVITERYSNLSDELEENNLKKMKKIIYDYAKENGVNIKGDFDLNIVSDSYGNKYINIIDTVDGSKIMSIIKDYKYNERYSKYKTYPGMNIISTDREKINSMLFDVVKINHGYDIAKNGDKTTGERIIFEIDNFRVPQFNKYIESENNPIIRQQMEQALKDVEEFKSKLESIVADDNG